MTTPKPPVTRSALSRIKALLALATILGGLTAAVRGLVGSLAWSAFPPQVWVLLALALVLVVLPTIALAALRTCWPSQSGHRKELLEIVLRRITERRRPST